MVSTTTGLFQGDPIGRRTRRRENSICHKSVKGRCRQMDNAIYRRINTISMGKLGRIRPGTQKPVRSRRREGRSKDHTQQHETSTEINDRILERIQTGSQRNRIRGLNSGRIATKRNEPGTTERVGSLERQLYQYHSPRQLGNRERNKVSHSTTYSETQNGNSNTKNK